MSLLQNKRMDKRASWYKFMAINAQTHTGRSEDAALRLCQYFFRFGEEPVDVQLQGCLANFNAEMFVVLASLQHVAGKYSLSAIWIQCDSASAMNRALRRQASSRCHLPMHLRSLCAEDMGWSLSPEQSAGVQCFCLIPPSTRGHRRKAWANVRQLCVLRHDKDIA